MRTVGIICEYNPFHNGHKRQIDMLRSIGYDCVICVMSGNYTQRGELAIFDKYTRAKAAVLGGADLVLELPFPYSSFSAEGFANSGVHILASLGINAICFGSECGNISILESAADALLSPDFSRIYSEKIKLGCGSATAYFDTLSSISGEEFSLLSNDILAISYIAAVKRSNHNIDIIPIKREGAAFNSKTLSKSLLPSASAIRETINENNLSFYDSLIDHIPEKTLKCLSDSQKESLSPVSEYNIEREILSFFKLLTADEISSRAISRSHGGCSVADDGCGIVDRLCNTAKDAKCYDDFKKNMYTTRYTDARINRVLLFSILGISDVFCRTLPEYTNLLAANASGRDFLSHIRRTCNIPIITKPANAPDNTPQREISEHADELYSMAFPSDKSTAFFIKSHPFML